jgi:hypothetical protein
VPSAHEIVQSCGVLPEKLCNAFVIPGIARSYFRERISDFFGFPQGSRIFYWNHKSLKKNIIALAVSQNI